MRRSPIVRLVKVLAALVLVLCGVFLFRYWRVYAEVEEVVFDLRYQVRAGRVAELYESRLTEAYRKTRSLDAFVKTNALKKGEWKYLRMTNPSLDTLSISLAAGLRDRVEVVISTDSSIPPLRTHYEHNLKIPLRKVGGRWLIDGDLDVRESPMFRFD